MLSDIHSLIKSARQEVAVSVNESLTTLYWRIGKRIYIEMLGGKRAEYGEQIVYALSAQLQIDYGEGFSKRNLFNMVRFAEAYPDENIVSALRRQLSWTHFKVIIYIDDSLKRDFYAEMCRLERWSTRALEKKIGSMLYERTVLSRKPNKVIEHDISNLRKTDQVSPDLVFKDPYFLDFLGLKDRYIEKDIEDSILREMENFLLELGMGFTFVERQKRISLDDVDYYLDLLFYHRGLHRLVAIELKLDDFKPAYKGQMDLYLRWLKKYEMKPDEKEPIGLILCAGKKDETIELLEMEKSGIRVAQYLTELPRKDILEKRLHEAIQRVRLRLANKA
ncbi:MAG: cytoplasmic protein [Candidatus Firestonebacteria bacterium RIFOXYA2_FULL_40_8]|nr:MAG: cytoplasmic protein [Candidatus Firestonebacteria bacterium RIFOXYA2_FULL_40_8]